MNGCSQVAPALQAAVLHWGDEARRDLPWRATRDPWAILVSELMLAQTQAARVIPKWQAFVARWPDPGACAQASVGEVITAWTGLGYNRRAVFLHRAATAIVDRHAGVVPDDLPALLALPGVGPYTARAVLAFAFEHRVGVVDTNAARVLARAFAGRTLGSREAQAWADAAVPAGAGWAWNQAMLDLGATCCTARRRACDRCPLGPGRGGPPLCRWAGAGGPDPAAGSAGTSRRQSTFAGSDRQGRGRLLAALTAGPGAGGLPPGALAAAAGWPDDPARAAAAARSLVADGLAKMDAGGALGLP
ncbi:MAG TPA: A/G-specific adenine glycosylase [Acidimicrobiales bacterium]